MVIAFAGVAPAAPAASAGTGCRVEPYGLIGERYARLGGAATFGCAERPEYDVYQNSVWVGRRQTFGRGQIAWSPSQGSTMVVAAWRVGVYVHFHWGPTNPFSYDKFLVRGEYTNIPGKWFQATVRGGTGGQVKYGLPWEDHLRFVVEGCDNTAGGSRCRQSWTIGVIAP